MGATFRFFPANFDVIHIYDRNNPCFRWTNRHSQFGIFSHPSSNKASSNSLSHNNPANGWPYKCRSRSTTGSSILPHDLGHLCRGRRIQTSGHSAFGISKNLPENTASAVCPSQSDNRAITFITYAAVIWRRRRALFSKKLRKLRSRLLQCHHGARLFHCIFCDFGSDSAFLRWHMSISVAKCASWISFVLLTLSSCHVGIVSSFFHSLSTAAFASGIFIAWGVGINLWQNVMGHRRETIACNAIFVFCKLRRFHSLPCGLMRFHFSTINIRTCKCARDVSATMCDVTMTLVSMKTPLKNQDLFDPSEVCAYRGQTVCCTTELCLSVDKLEEDNEQRRNDVSVQCLCDVQSVTCWKLGILTVHEIPPEVDLESSRSARSGGLMFNWHCSRNTVFVCLQLDLLSYVEHNSRRHNTSIVRATHQRQRDVTGSIHEWCATLFCPWRFLMQRLDTRQLSGWGIEWVIAVCALSVCAVSRPVVRNVLRVLRSSDHSPANQQLGCLMLCRQRVIHQLKCKLDVDNSFMHQTFVAELTVWRQCSSPNNIRFRSRSFQYTPHSTWDLLFINKHDLPARFLAKYVLEWTQIANAEPFYPHDNIVRILLCDESMISILPIVCRMPESISWLLLQVCWQTIECLVSQFVPSTSILRQSVSILWITLQQFPILLVWSDGHPNKDFDTLYNCFTCLFANS